MEASIGTSRKIWRAGLALAALWATACSSDAGGGAVASSGAGGGGSSGGQVVGAGGTGGGAGTTFGAAAGSGAGTAAGGVPSAGASGGPASGGAGAGSAGAGAGGGAGAAGAGGGPPKQSGTPLVYVGGFGNFPLRVYELDRSSGKLTQRGGDEDGGRSPSYLALDPSGTHLYNANEDDGSSAGVTAHRIEPDGTLAPLNHQQGSDKSPAQLCGGSCGFTFVAVDPSGKFLLAADYDGGSVSVFPIGADGSLGPEKALLDFGNQAEAHSVGFDASGQYVFVPTLGLDQVQQLKLLPDGSLSPNSPASVDSAPSSGPRHIAVHPGGKLAFVMNETASTMTPYAVSSDGKLTPGSSVSTLPPGASGESYGQHVEVSPDGRFVYGSNVGHDSIVVFSVDQASGALTPLQDQPSGGMWPRDFDVDPNGDFLVVANRDSDSLVVLAVGSDGKLSQLGQPTKVPSQPTSVVIRYQP